MTTDYLLGKSSQKSIDISELSEEQGAHVMLLVNDFAKINKKSK